MIERLRILIADDHEQCRWVMTRLLNAHFEVVGAVADGRQLVDAAVALQPDIIVSDISMPFLSGIEAMKELHHEGFEFPLVLVSAGSLDANVVTSKWHPTSFVRKTDIGLELVPAVLAAFAGRMYTSRSAELTSPEHYSMLR